MNDELAIKVQAFLDGELPEAEAREISSLIAGDADVAALHRELKQTRAALTGFERHIAVPETREFYWSKIAREIEHTDSAREQPATQPVSLARWLRRILVPAAGLAMLAVALMVTTHTGRPSPVMLETSFADAGAMTYRNYESGATLVWLSYPAENGLAHSNTADSIN